MSDLTNYRHMLAYSGVHRYVNRSSIVGVVDIEEVLSTTLW